MRKDKVKHTLEVLNAWQNGEEIQYWSCRKGEWVAADPEYINNMINIKAYRIKPKPREWILIKYEDDYIAIKQPSIIYNEDFEEIRVREVLDAD